MKKLMLASATLALIAGPCVIEEPQRVFAIAAALCGICAELGLPLIFKASFDKANRSSHTSARGVGMEKGLDILAEVKARFRVPLLTDIHESAQFARGGGGWLCGSVYRDA